MELNKELTKERAKKDLNQQQIYVLQPMIDYMNNQNQPANKGGITVTTLKPKRIPVEQLKLNKSSMVKIAKIKE